VKARFKLKEGSRGVGSCAISPCLRYIACIDLHNDHHVSIFNIKKNKHLMTTEGSKDKIIHCAWSKKVDDLRFCTVGAKEIKFWNPADASKRLSVKGVFGTKGKQTSFSCVTFDIDGNAYTAAINGMIYVWDITSTLDKVVKAHSGEVHALVHENGKLISGAKDNKLIIFSTIGGEIKQEKVIEFENSFPKSLDYFNGKILVGMRNGNIYEIDEATEVKTLLMACHHEGEAWGLDYCEKDKSLFSIGDDNKVLQFNYEQKKFIA